jgi:curli biogenesis system outer membrane secretion channel CsgG
MKKLVFLVVSLILFVSCSKKVYLNVTKPAQYDVSDIKRIAVVDFKGPKNSGELVASKFVSSLWKTRYFSILERKQLQTILEEHALQMSGIINDSTAVEFGRLLGVDGLIFGEIFDYSVKDTKGTEKVKEKVWTGEYEKDKNGKIIYEGTGKIKTKKKKYKEAMVNKKFIRRNVNVGINFRMVSVETGEIRASDSKTRSFSKKYSVEEGKLPPAKSILNNLSNNIVASFVPLISPHRVQISRTFEKGNDAIGLGIEMAQNNLWDKAKDIWNSEADKNPKNSAAQYNLGIAYEVLGDLVSAEYSYEKALDIEPKDLYMQALSNVRRRKVEQDTLNKQLNRNP